MDAQQPPGSNTPASRSLGRALLWPAVAVGLGFLLVYNSFDTSAVGRPMASSAASATTAPWAAATGPGPALPRSVPKRIVIPEIAVDAPFTELSLGASGQLEAPPAHDNNLVGWYKGAATPGERGTSIVAGHVDTATGPAVFVELSMLKSGSKVDITRADGTVAKFKVDSVESFSKAKFPNERVYADTPTAQLRLITCGGEYDKKAKDYKENVVVFAHLDSVKRA
ncbi:class F sortase [Streptomyces sannanensis]|uniref:Class F sortase n=1 Tax=Streptomyces sannanensis TaxID=285536 RepID=A0ABP6SKT2_9ACTN